MKHKENDFLPLMEKTLQTDRSIYKQMIFLREITGEIMAGISRQTLNFLTVLAVNNDREWFSNNRNLYLRAKEEFEILIGNFIERVSAFEPILKGLEPSSCIFRINRDIRFSADKSPYKSHFGALVMRGGRKNIHRFAGYYIHIEPGESKIAGGAYLPPTPWLTAIREKIAGEPDVFTGIIENKKFRQLFGELDNDKLKSAPKGFRADHPYIELLKYKSYLVAKSITDKEVISMGFPDYAVEIAKTMKPLNDFLNECAG